MIGARCEIPGKVGTWIVAEGYPSATPPSWRCLRVEGDHLMGIDATEDQVVVVEPPPVFAPGRQVNIGFGEKAVVVQDRGDDVVVEVSRNAPAGSSGRLRWRGTSTVSKSVIVIYS